MKRPAKKSAKRTTKPAGETVLILRTVAADMRSPDEATGGVAAKSFKWPKRGEVECKDWNPAPVCGGGLHGLRWGAGDVGLTHHEDATRLWLVIEAAAADVVDVGSDKCKLRRGTVVYCGDRGGAVALVQSRAPAGSKVCFATVTGGNRSTVTGGNASTVTGGNRSTVTGGNASTVTGGNASTVTGGNASTVTGGNRSTVTGGHTSVLSLRWYDGSRWRIAIFAVGENGIEPNVAYRLDDNGKPVRVEKAEAAK
jgi:hypothetical protein